MKSDEAVQYNIFVQLKFNKYCGLLRFARNDGIVAMTGLPQAMAQIVAARRNEIRRSSPVVKSFLCLIINNRSFT
jgi:hypothetical protein